MFRGWFGGGVVSGYWVYGSFMIPFLGCLWGGSCVVWSVFVCWGSVIVFYGARICALALFRDKAARAKFYDETQSCNFGIPNNVATSIPITQVIISINILL